MKTLLILLALLLSPCAWGQENFISAVLLPIDSVVIHKQMGTGRGWIADKRGEYVYNIRAYPEIPDSNTFVGTVGNMVSMTELGERYEDAEIARHFLRLWDGYAKDCFADSTKRFVHNRVGECMVNTNPPRLAPIIEIVDWDAGNVCENPKHHKSHWTHRTPSLPGFVEYLRKK